MKSRQEQLEVTRFIRRRTPTQHCFFTDLLDISVSLSLTGLRRNQLLTLNDDMHFCGFWFLVCEDGADVGPLVMDVNILDHDAVLCDGCVFHQDDARVQRPLLTSCEENGGAVEPGHS